MKIGRFASQKLRTEDDRPLCAITTGLRFDLIEVRLTPRDFDDVHVNRWISTVLSSRRADPSVPLTIYLVV